MAQTDTSQGTLGAGEEKVLTQTIDIPTPSYGRPKSRSYI